jgi:hypothetical protein
MEIDRSPKLARTSFVVTVLSILSLAGCTGTTSAGKQGTPGPPSQLNTYVGTQSPGDVWTVTINHNTNSFSYADITAGTNMATVTGLLVTDNGFLNLGETNTPPAFQPAGFALEILGRAALVRPGVNTNPLVPLVAQSSCPVIGSQMNLQFVTLPNSTWAAATDTAYGSFQVSTNGTTWNFSSYQQFTLAGSSNQAGAMLSPGVCAQSLAGMVVTIPPNTTVSTTGTLALGPSGFFLVDQGSGSPGLVGVVQPSTTVSAANVVSGQYFGFMYEPAAALTGLPVTQMAAFGCTGSSCVAPPSQSSIVGGVFSTDDPSQPANMDTTITLGSQNSASNGLFGNSSVTLPDPSSVCNTGTGMCTFPAVAVVGNPENKFAMFLIAQDIVNNSPLVFILYQQ